MALQRVTMQDIADACGLSRNTVSKTFNGRGAVPEATRRMVLDKARELGYRQLPGGEQPEAVSTRRNIALFTGHMPSDYHFGTLVISAFASQLSRSGYTLTVYELSPEDILEKNLPEQFSMDRTAGTVGIELFNKDYLDMVSGLGLPCIFIDAYAGANTAVLGYDLISMENIASSRVLTGRMIEAGARRVGFVGDLTHCNSFNERWTGYTLALTGAGMTPDQSICILDRDGPHYADPAWIAEKLRRMPVMPDGLVCANDSIALNTMAALKQMGLTVPDRIMVSGFDGTPQSAVVEPALSTAQIPSADMGRLAAEILLDRIENPDRPFRTTYVSTTPLFRASTER